MDTTSELTSDEKTSPAQIKKRHLVKLARRVLAQNKANFEERTGQTVAAASVASNEARATERGGCHAVERLLGAARQQGDGAIEYQKKTEKNYGEKARVQGTRQLRARAHVRERGRTTRGAIAKDAGRRRNAKGSEGQGEGGREAAAGGREIPHNERKAALSARRKIKAGDITPTSLPRDWLPKQPGGGEREGEYVLP